MQYSPAVPPEDRSGSFPKFSRTVPQVGRRFEPHPIKRTSHLDRVWSKGKTCRRDEFERVAAAAEASAFEVCPIAVGEHLADQYPDELDAIRRRLGLSSFLAADPAGPTVALNVLDHFVSESALPPRQQETGWIAWWSPKRLSAAEVITQSSRHRHRNTAGPKLPPCNQPPSHLPN